MIIEISVAVIAVCFLLILIRLYTMSIRIEDSIRRFEEFLSRMETDLRPALYDARNIANEMRGIVEAVKRGTKKLDYVAENVLQPLETLGIFLKAARIGINAFLKKERRG